MKRVLSVVVAMFVFAPTFAGDFTIFVYPGIFQASPDHSLGGSLWEASGAPAKELIARMRRLRSIRPPIEPARPADLAGLKRQEAELRKKIDEAKNPPPGIGLFFFEDRPTTVSQLLIGGPAESAGIGIGDVFVKVNGHSVGNTMEIVRLVNEGTGPIEVVLKGKGPVVLSKQPPEYLSPDFLEGLESEHRTIRDQIDALEQEASQPTESPFIAERGGVIASAIQQLEDKLLKAQMKAFTERYRSS